MAQAAPELFGLHPSQGGRSLAVEAVFGLSQWRIFRTYLAARAVAGVLLVALQFLAATDASAAQPAPLLIGGLYAASALGTAAWLLWRGGMRSIGASPRTCIALTVGVDLIAFLLLSSSGSGTGLNFDALLVLPVLMAGVLMPRLQALATAAGLTLALLAEAWWRSLMAPTPPSAWLGAALAGVGLLVIAWVAGELSARLQREERSALDSQARADRQAGLNRLVIQEMSEGVLVLDRRRRVLAINLSAQALLGAQVAAAASQQGAADPVLPWSPILRAVERAHAEGDWPAAGREVAWSDGPASVTELRVRMRFTRLEAVSPATRDAVQDDDLCVLLLEDERTVQARVQQDKLAAMGRVSAGIAHEIRNPLAAIAQANELLSEDRLDKPQQRLVSIIGDNVVRLRRLVDDVLESTPSPVAGRGSVLQVADLVLVVVQDWSATAGAPADLVERDLRWSDARAWFDPEHLRRILVNLLDNALWHSSGRAGAIRVAVQPGLGDGVTLVVSNDGPPIAPEVEMQLFEPFFSTRSRGSGLGLYLSKELCERHGATIMHARSASSKDHHTNFVIELRGPSAATTGRGPS
ncbi:MAG: sensor histidine kinase [Rubrivivax sp.]